MSAISPPAQQPRPDTVTADRGGNPRRIVAALIAALAVLASLILPTQSAQAATIGPSFGNDSIGYVGAFVAESDGRQVYCLDMLAADPTGQYTSGPTTVTNLTSYNGNQLSATNLARLNYVLSKWGESSSPPITAAVQLYVWSVADAGNYDANVSRFLSRIPAGDYDAVLANLATMQAEAAANASANPSVTVVVNMRDQYNGTLTVTVDPSVLSGNVALTNARFQDGTTSKAVGTGTYPIVGTPPSGAPAYQVSASASYSASGIGARVNVYDTPGAQRLMAAGTPAAVTAHAESPVIPLDFQPVIGTQVASKFVAEGEPFVDELLVDTVGMGDWVVVDGSPVPLTAVGTLYGPFEEQPAESETVPEGAPVAGTETLLLDLGTGSYTSAGSIVAEEAGFYTWVWSIDKTAQGDAAQYIRDGFTDWFGRVAETHVSPFQPVAISQSDARLAVPGDAVSDTLTVSSSNGAWLKIGGEPIPVTFTGTAYQVPGTLPPVDQAGVPADAVPLGTVEVVALGPGVYTSPTVVFPDAGFVTWVWEMRLGAQPEEYRNYLADNWVDNYGIPVESTSVRHPVSITSEAREYNVHLNGRAFDEILVTGFPENHGDFTGDGYWGADLDEIVHTVYGPFGTDAVLTDDLDLDASPVLTSITTPARNGLWRIGYTDADRIQPTEPGYYVIVSSFDGDDRVQPYRSSPADVLERFYVPEAPVPGVDVQVTTKAQPEAWVGEDFSDTATVTGDRIPEGSYLVFRAYGPFDEQPADGEAGEPFFVSEEIPVAGPGDYESGLTRVDRAGLVFWVETLYTAEGEILVEGYIGAPGETTIVRDKPAPPGPETPSPGKLAETGGGAWTLPLSVAGVLLGASGLTLWFGRRLAQYRQRAGYVRDEDLMSGEEFEALFDE